MVSFPISVYTEENKKSTMKWKEMEHIPSPQKITTENSERERAEDDEKREKAR